jgi:uncharacterized protein YbjQ (UPF0145 family)
MPYGIALPPPPRRPVIVTVPQPRNSRQPPLKPGDTFAAKVEDKKKILVKVPEGAAPGQQMQVLIPEYSQMVASTLTGPPPGCKVFMEHPIIVANVSHQIQGPTKELASSKKVTTLMQKAQRDLLRKASFAGCNAVLGINFNITTTSSSTATSNSTLALVSAYGTPCIVASEPDSGRGTMQELPSGMAPGVPSGIPAESQSSTGPGATLVTADAESEADHEEFCDTEGAESDICSPTGADASRG